MMAEPSTNDHALARVIKTRHRRLATPVAPLDTARFLWGTFNGSSASHCARRLKLDEQQMRAALAQGVEILFATRHDTLRGEDGRLPRELHQRLHAALNDQMRSEHARAQVTGARRRGSFALHSAAPSAHRRRLPQQPSAVAERTAVSPLCGWQ